MLLHYSLLIEDLLKKWMLIEYKMSMNKTQFPNLIIMMKKELLKLIL